MKHLLLGFIFGISLSFISWIVGMIVNSILMKTEYYNKLSNLNFIENKGLNKTIGLTYFKWAVKNTFFKFFNQKLKVDSKSTDLAQLRNDMIYSEISHLIGFIFVTFFAIFKSFEVGFIFGLTMMIPNILMNLYPSLLQQENKRRIDRILKIKTVANKV
ncbi:glycosyl-4,4'-diaponeurosporenoate acyltransferase CrtO family protein [Winogradskyella aurantia]|uniref:Glycosyl-4,4'-diaponeurosporenoate acyltransferase n=1 Tax=Winogradskyella aurantia TaxID=1915063 RepID=A0A265USA8_9FLAO|nr:hypothetical protein [Winogradskyella aurantia]OZV68199.1 hypothetical protein CA834_11070 [Winogradskyella aurantia]